MVKKNIDLVNKKLYVIAAATNTFRSFRMIDVGNTHTITQMGRWNTFTKLSHVALKKTLNPCRDYGSFYRRATFTTPVDLLLVITNRLMKTNKRNALQLNNPPQENYSISIKIAEIIYFAFFLFNPHTSYTER